MPSCGPHEGYTHAHKATQRQTSLKIRSQANESSVAEEKDMIVTPGKVPLCYIILKKLFEGKRRH